MKALTIWQPWASLIMVGAKLYEFRTWPAPRAIRGQRIVIHAGARPMRATELAGLMSCDADDLRKTLGMVDDRQLGAALDLLDKLWQRRKDPVASQLGMALGVATLGEPQRCTAIFKGDGTVAHHMWGWPLSNARHFEMPVPIKGAQGFWDWPGEVPALAQQEAA